MIGRHLNATEEELPGNGHVLGHILVPLGVGEGLVHGEAAPVVPYRCRYSQCWNDSVKGVWCGEGISLAVVL